jgi:hypothetical protein
LIPKPLTRQSAHNRGDTSISHNQSESPIGPEAGSEDHREENKAEN